jgi:nitrate reductase NapE component
MECAKNKDLVKNCSFSFLNHDYTEEDEKDEFKVFLFILFIFFSVIMVQKTE